MDTVTTTATYDEHSFERAIEKNYRWNFVVNVLDSTLFWFGLSFASGVTILPLYVSHLTDNPMLIGLVPAIGQAGWLLPQLFTANYVERLPCKKPMAVRIGLFSERLPVLFMALTTLWLAAERPTLALVAFFVTYAWFAFGAGLIATAWQDMIAKVIPVRRRGGFFGLANSAGTGMGVLGASGAALVLERYPFPQNFGWCFLVAFAFVLTSWFFLALTREPPLHSRKPRISQQEFWRHLPAILRADANFSRFLLVRITSGLGGMGVGFVAVYGIQNWGLPDSQVGVFTAVLLAAQTVFNLGFGLLADRFGHKLGLELATLSSALAMAAALLAPSPTWLYVSFAGIGATSAGFMISGLMIVFEFTGAEDRPTYIGLANTISGTFSGISPLLGGWIARHWGYQPLFAVALGLVLTASALLHWGVQEPRQAVERAARSVTGNG